MFTVENSGENAGQIRVTGTLDRETDTIHTVNIRVMLSFMTLSLMKSSSCRLSEWLLQVAPVLGVLLV